MKPQTNPLPLAARLGSCVRPRLDNAAFVASGRAAGAESQETTVHDPEELIPVRCEHCGSIERLTPQEEARLSGPFYCSGRCEDLDENFRAAEAQHDRRLYDDYYGA